MMPARRFLTVSGLHLDAEELTRQQARGQHDGIDVDMIAPGRVRLIGRRQPEGFDRVRQRNEPLQGFDLRRQIAGRQAGFDGQALMQRLDSMESYRQPELTERERECLQWISAGRTRSEVGEILHLSENTVSFHLKNVHRKLEAGSSTLAIVKALRFRLISLWDNENYPVG